MSIRRPTPEFVFILVLLAAFSAGRAFASRPHLPARASAAINSGR
jgi:hypothetical protein